MVRAEGEFLTVDELADFLQIAAGVEAKAIVDEGGHAVRFGGIADAYIHRH